MATAPINTLIRHLRHAALLQDGAGRTDGELLESFIDQKDEAAFAALLRRHAPMILSVCRRVVRNHHDAEDAFQAAFLVLARKASSIRPREKVASWLHGVAYRTALKARTMAAKRQVREKQVKQMPEPEAMQEDPWHDLQPLLDEELNRLPENYRLPILLCDLEGKSIKTATEQLGWPQGTLAGRLARARKMLAKRLTQRGVAFSGGALGTLLSEKAVSACVSSSLAGSTIKAAIAIAAGQAATNLVTAQIAALMEGVLKSMMLTKLKTLAAVLLVLSMFGLGGGLLSRPMAAGQEIKADQQSDKAVANKGAFRLEVVPGTQIQRFSATSQEKKNERAPKTKADSPMSLDEAKLHGEWTGKVKEVNVSLIFGPNNSIRRITENRHYEPDDVGTYSVDLSKKPHHLDTKFGKLAAFQNIIEFIEPGKLRIEFGANRQGAEMVAELPYPVTDVREARPKAFTDEAIVLTRKAKAQAGSKQVEKAAERELAVGDFYRRTARFGSAYFYYELIQHRYPNTEYAKKAQQRIEDLKQYRIRLPDGSEGWATPDEGRPPPQPPPEIQQIPNEKEAANNHKVPQPPQPPPPVVRGAPTTTQSIHELKDQVKSLESRIKALEVQGKPQPPPKAGRDAPAPSQEIEKLRQQMKNLEGRLRALEAKGERESKTSRIGQIIVVGNTNTPTSVILKKMDLFPGQALNGESLRKAQKNLAAFDATVEAIDSDDPGFKDLLVTVKKR